MDDQFIERDPPRHRRGQVLAACLGHAIPRLRCIPCVGERSEVGRYTVAPAGFPARGSGGCAVRSPISFLALAVKTLANPPTWSTSAPTGRSGQGVGAAIASYGSASIS